jgi:hypothetical protein
MNIGRAASVLKITLLLMAAVLLSACNEQATSGSSGSVTAEASTGGSTGSTAGTSSSGGTTATTGAGVTQTGSTTGMATLSWVAPTLNTNGTAVTDLTSYTIYYGTSSTALTQSVNVPGGTSTSYVVSSLSAGTWFFAVAANASDGTQSAKSTIGSKTIT